MINTATVPSGWTSNIVSEGSRVVLGIPGDFIGTDEIMFNITTTHTTDGTTLTENIRRNIEVFEPFFTGTLGADPAAFVPNSSLTDQGRLTDGTTRVFTPATPGTRQYFIVNVPNAFSNNPRFIVDGQDVVPDAYPSGRYTTYVLPMKRRRNITISR